MWRFICVMLLLTASCNAGPVVHQRKHVPREDIAPNMQQESNMDTDSPAETETQAATSAAAAAAPLVGTLTLPSNATSIRADITDNFSCANKSYGYYADVENDCQIFHVCLPVTYADGKENTFRWSFICPEETIFSQESFTCMRREDMAIECEDSYRYYELNSNFGLPAEEEKQPAAVESEQPDQEEEVPVRPAAAAPAPASEPVPVALKPVKVQKPKPKPVRRKPAVTYNKPPRKAAVVATAAPVIKLVDEPEPEPEPEVVASLVVQQTTKPVKPQRFNVRPNKKEKPQVIKPVISATAAPVRNELFNSIRKRPAIFNKASTTSKPMEETEPAVTEAISQAELSEPEPTLKLQTMFVETAPMAVNVAEPEAQASETAKISIAHPETEPEVAPAAEQIKTEEPSDKNEDELIPIEAIQEIPAVIVETLEEKPEEIHQMESKPTEMEVMPAERQPEPAIMESSSSNEVESSNSIEALESEKPADAPESLPATPEMAQPSPMIEQMLENTNNNANNEVPESIGGFKPVDPVMAAEAEQLITDFLNTLRKHDEKTETELDMAETVEQQQQQQQTEVKDDSKPTVEESNDVSIEEAKLPEPEIVDKNASVEEQLIDAESQQKLKQDSPIIKIMQLNHLPADYQIPVQVVAAVPELLPTANEEKETLSESKLKPVEEPVAHDDAQKSVAKAAHMPPISIDDIVSLVKERLDQNPKNEQMTAMELVLTPGAAAPMTLIQSTLETKSEQAVDPTPVAVEQIEQQEEILPIYKRVSDVEQAKISSVVAELRQPKSHARMDARKRRFLFRADAS